MRTHLNYSAGRIDADVFCPECFGPMLYVGAGEKTCAAHPDVHKGISIFEVVQRLRKQ